MRPWGFDWSGPARPVYDLARRAKDRVRPGGQETVVEVLRERGREISRQKPGEGVLSVFEAPNRRNTGSIPRFGNEELAEKIRPRRGLTFTTRLLGCLVSG